MAGDHAADAAATCSKLFASRAHQILGELAMDVAGQEGLVTAGRGVDGPGLRATALLVEPCRDDLRRHVGDPAQHHLRARARTAPVGPAMTTTPLAPPVPAQTEAMAALRAAVREFLADELAAGRFTPQVDSWIAGWIRSSPAAR